MPTDPTPLHATPPPRARHWKLSDRVLEFKRRPLLMGIVNVTPDSFSDGGRFFDPDAAIEHGLRLADEGAEILDVGGESTRPGAQAVDADEELRRVLPVVTQLCRQTSVPVSIDTSKAAVARAAVDAGAQIVNDVTALAGDPDMIATVVVGGVGACVMHIQGTPRTMQQNPVYDDVVQEVFDALRARRDVLVDAGIEPDRIAVDPGIGFGKTTGHNLSLLTDARRLHALGCPVLVGPSRKRFLGELLGDATLDRTAGTVGVALALARQGVQVIRVHDVAPVHHAITLYEATGGLD